MRFLLNLFPAICTATVVIALCGDPRVCAQGGPPLITDDPGTPGNGHWEINTAFTAEKRLSDKLFESPLLDINYGLGDSIQLKYEVPWLVLDQDGQYSKNGLGNSLIGVKWRFFDQDSHGLDMSVYPQLAFNNTDSSADRGLVDRGTELAMPFQFRRSFGRWSLNPEIGYVFRQYDKDEWMYSLATGYEVSKRIELLAEIGGLADQDFDEDELVFNLGGRMKLSERHKLLLSVGRSLRSSSTGEPELLAYAGLQLVF